MWGNTHRSYACIAPESLRSSWLSNLLEQSELIPRSVLGVLNVIYRPIILKNKQRCRLIGLRMLKLPSCALVMIPCLRATATSAWCWPDRTDACKSTTHLQGPIILDGGLEATWWYTPCWWCHGIASISVDVKFFKYWLCSVCFFRLCEWLIYFLTLTIVCLSLSLRAPV